MLHINYPKLSQFKNLSQTFAQNFKNLLGNFQLIGHFNGPKFVIYFVK